MERNLILLVDDEKDICAELSIFLSKIGHNVIVANNVSDAMELFLSRKPSVVLTDYMMPSQTGIDLLRSIKAIDNKINVVLMSGVADVRTGVLAMKENAFDFLQKPIDLDQLGKVIKNALERSLLYDVLKNQKKTLSHITRSDSDWSTPIAVLYFNVNLDEFSSEKYKQEIVTIFKDSMLKSIIIDLERVQYINNMGLHLLVHFTDILKEHNIDFFICNLTNPVRYYINTLGYEKHFNVIDSKEDAFRKLLSLKE